MKEKILKIKEDLFYFLKEVEGAFLKAYLFVLCLPGVSLARDFLSSVENASSQIRQIITVVGVLALMVAGVCFYWSKRLGMEKLSAAIIGTVVFAAASTIFTLFYRTFN